MYNVLEWPSAKSIRSFSYQKPIWPLNNVRFSDAHSLKTNFIIKSHFTQVNTSPLFIDRPHKGSI